MHTAALPFGAATTTRQFVPRVLASRAIPAMYQPSFGILPYGVLPGTVRVGNAFYNPLLQFVNTLVQPLPPGNMPSNRYLGYMPGISRAPMP